MSLTPAVGEVYERAIEADTAYRVEAIGQTTGTLYLRLMIDGAPTPCTLEWQGDRWAVLVAREGLEKAP